MATDVVYKSAGGSGLVSGSNPNSLTLLSSTSLSSCTIVFGSILEALSRASCSRLAFISAILSARLFLGLSVVLRSIVSATASNTDARAGSGNSSNPLSSESTTFCGLAEQV